MTQDIFSLVEKEFLLSKEQLKPIIEGFIQEYKTGLKTPSKGLATMIPSFVTKMPMGNETGTFLSLDLGGTNLRIAAVELRGAGKTTVHELKRCPSTELKTGEGSVFFDWIADAIQELITVEARHLFSTAQVEGKETLSLGVCWSFPVDQTAVDRGTILRMGKGFTLKNTEGNDLADMFHEAFQRKNLNVKVTAILNDTVGALVAHAYRNPACRIGLIFATGINAAYPEKVPAITKLNPEIRRRYPPGTEMLINTEIDIFGTEAYLPLTKYDLALDCSHNQPKFQLYEKMLSGAYMGELTRLIAMDFIQAGALFGGEVPEGFDRPWSFPTKYMSILENDETETKEASFDMLSQFPSRHGKPTMEDITTLTRLCRIVASRSASLAAVAIISLLEQQELMGQENVVIGINGSTYEFYPHMDKRVRQALDEWYGPEVSSKITLEVASEGGSVGGALIAMLCE
ncbi:glucokinase [Rhizopus azygosporus]|uniref:Phosphotransferase n=1 Tax=Rhizopus azygosporus TaxID=86630 RepID=A0A367JTM8_RHIAZ|nr:glucokinase [Rhizopus azygosporus]